MIEIEIMNIFPQKFPVLHFLSINDTLSINRVWGLNLCLTESSPIPYI